MKTLNVGIFIYHDVEVLDFAGPFEVFNVANSVSQAKLFNVYLVAETEKVIFANGNFKVLPDYDFAEMPDADILLIPGGPGRKQQMHQVPVLNWIKHEANQASLLLSVCTGAFILGNAGLLNHSGATTHYDSYQEFEEAFPKIRLIRDVKYADQGKVITSGGITAGIDMCIRVIERIHGTSLARDVARRMEYEMDWQVPASAMDVADTHSLHL